MVQLGHPPPLTFSTDAASLPVATFKVQTLEKVQIVKMHFFLEIFPVFTFYSPAHSIHLIHTIWPSLSFSQYIGPLPKFLVDDDGGVEYDIE